MQHMYLSDNRPICTLSTPVEEFGRTTRMIYGVVECPDCLTRAIHEAEERVRVLRELLAKVEALS